jgi:hypothetical protein
MDYWRDNEPDDLRQPPSRWLFEHYDEYRDWMQETQTYEQYFMEHAAEPVNPVVPKNWYKVDVTEL